jgi:DNA-binding response OmpR family regulator
MFRVLLVEDDDGIVRNLKDFLNDEGFYVETTDGQSKAEAKMDAGQFDLLLVDITLSEGNGFGVCSAARARDLPVIFLTASGDEYSVVTGLDMGADDYVSKPFRPRELVSRIRSVLRRRGKGQSILTLGDIAVDIDKGIATKNGAELFLTALEYRLLLVFLNNKGTVLSRGKLLEEIWDIAGDFVNDNTLTVYVKRLREKLGDDPHEPRLIKTVRGMGYRVE